MGKYYDMLMEDVRMREGMRACMNCGVCTAVCPSAEFYCYDPRQIVNTIQMKDDEAIEALLCSDTIWYCGECMSCRPRCPRENTPGYVIQALRTLSQRLGFFTRSEKGRQQFALKKFIGEHILDTGYCLTPKLISPSFHQEQGPVWKWAYENDKEVWGMHNPTYREGGAGVLRRIADDAMEELRSIFEVTGSMEFFDTIERYSDEKAKEMGYEGADDKYLMETFTADNGNHH